MSKRIRLSLQLIFVILLLYVAARPIFDKQYLADFEKYCPFGGISSFFSKLNQDTMACSMSETQVFLGLFLLLTAALIGKLFCSFVCPIGSVSEWIGKFGNKFKLRKDLPQSADRLLRGLKYILLFITVYFTMTTSELFCKEYDPYFAIVNLFSNGDIVLFYAIPAVFLTIAGALFFRLVWCKYLCPLGAFSNIFMNTAAALIVISVYFILNFFGARLSFVWLLGGLAAAGWINESFRMKSFFLPFPKIQRSEESCTHCGICDKKCPQGIKVSALPVVEHIDCHLCTDCIYACPAKNTLNINRKSAYRYLPPAAMILIIAAALIVSGFYEFTTISVRWNKPAGTGAVYSMSGLKDVKCYGSSMSLAAKLENIDGIYGLDTYAKSHTINVYFNPAIISAASIKEKLFTPAKLEIREPEGDRESVSVYQTGIYGVFDAVDINNLFLKLKQNGAVYGFEVQFGEPVKTNIYYNASRTTPNSIKDLIEQKITYSGLEDNEIKIETDLKTEGGIQAQTITRTAYKRHMFEIYDDNFNNFENYDSTDVALLKIPMPKAAEIKNRDFLDYMASHLSADEGILRFRVQYDDSPTAYIYYAAAKTEVKKILAAVTRKKLRVFTSQTETEEFDNPFN